MTGQTAMCRYEPAGWAQGLRTLRDKGRERVTLVHSSNAVPHTGRLRQAVFRAELAHFPELTGTEEYVGSFR